MYLKSIVLMTRTHKQLKVVISNITADKLKTSGYFTTCNPLSFDIFVTIHTTLFGTVSSVVWKTVLVASH